MKILVTGGAGFIGSHVVDGLLRAGHEVAVLDNFSTGYRDNVNPKVKIYEADLRDADAVNRAVSDFRPELIDHHAAQSEVPRSVRDPVFDAEVNLVGGINLLLAARAGQTSKIVFISTGGALYGEPEVLPCQENHPIRPLSPYGTSKYCFEQYLGTFKRTFGLDYTVLRYTNVYGPRQGFESEEGRVIALFASRMILNRPVTIDGTGEQARDMLYVADAVSANLAVLTAGSGEAYNIGTGAPVTVNRIFVELQQLSGYGLSPNYGPARQGDVYRIALDPHKAEQQLGWKATVSLAEGLAATVEDFRRMPDLDKRISGAT